MQNSPWKIIKDEVVEDFKIFSLRKSTRINPRTNKPFTFLLMDGYDWVNVLALTENNEVILVNQLRHGSGKPSLELPGGCVEKGEDPAESAKRELEEETGYKVSRIEKLGSLYANPALQSIQVHSYVAYDAVKTGSLKLDAGEDIETILIPLPEFLKKVKTCEIYHALIVAAAGLYVLHEGGL